MMTFFLAMGVGLREVAHLSWLRVEKNLGQIPVLGWREDWLD